jgi:uncharacterized membrane protein YvbJ
MTRCPKCGRENPGGAYFCTNCHQILIHRCPKCWHEQRQGGTCEKCGTNFALYWELAFERAAEEENLLWWDKLWAGILVFLQLMSIPFISFAGVLRTLTARIAAQTAASWLARKSR